jgi:hypothetical protein
MTEAFIGPVPEQELPQKLSEMLSLPKFQKALSTAARETQQTGHETAFDVDIPEGSSFWIENVRLGETDRMGISTIIEEIDGPRDYHLPNTDYFHFHFHPEKEAVITPSPDDLHVFLERENQPEFAAVGQVNERGKVKILVITRPRYRLVGSDVKFYESEIGKAAKQEEVRLLLGTIGLKSFLLETK